MSEETIEKVTEEPKKQKKGIFSESAIEVLVAIFLGITALLTAWASWIGSLHGGNQATNYTKSNNLASEGNSEYNSGLQDYLSDIMVWNTYCEYEFEKDIAVVEGDQEKIAIIDEKIDNYLAQNGSDVFNDAWNKMTDDMDSPFDVPNMADGYYVTANELLAESQRLLEEGQADNAHGDAYNLVNVIYSVVLFMLGIVGIFKTLPCRTAVFFISVVILLCATIYMFTIPMPTGFNLASFFGG